MHVTLIDSCIDTRGLNHGFDFIQMQHTILLLNITCVQKSPNLPLTNGIPPKIGTSKPTFE